MILEIEGANGGKNNFVCVVLGAIIDTLKAGSMEHTSWTEFMEDVLSQVISNEQACTILLGDGPPTSISLFSH